jgi:hypothetical protein
METLGVGMGEAFDGCAANQNNVAKQPITKTMTLRTNSGIRTKRANK